MKTTVLRRTKDLVSLASLTPDGVLQQSQVEILTLFWKTKVLIHAKTELLETIDRGPVPFGFVEIARCRALE